MSLQEISLNPLRLTNIKTVFIANLLLGIVNGFYNVLLQPYIVQFIPSAGKLGLLLTISSLTQSVTLILTAKISDKKGRKIVYLSSLLLFIFSMLLFSMSWAFLMVVAALLIFSFAFGLRDPAIQALTAESAEEEKRASSFSFVSLAFYGTGLIGPLTIRLVKESIDLRFYFFGLLGGFIVLYIFQLFNLRESLLIENIYWNIKKDFIESFKTIFIAFKQFLVSLVHFLLIPIVFIITKSSSSEHQNNWLINESKNEVELFSKIFKTPGVVYSLLFFIFDSFIWGLSISIFNGSSILVYGFTTNDIALFQLIFNLGTIVLFIPVTLFSDKLKKRELLMMSELIGSIYITFNIIAYFSNPIFRKIIIMIAWAGLGGSVAFWVPSIMSILTAFDAKRRAEIYGTISGIQSMGWLPTSLIAGLIIDKVSFLIPFLITLTLLPLDLFIASKFPEKKIEREKEM